MEFALFFKYGERGDIPQPEWSVYHFRRGVLSMTIPSFHRPHDSGLVQWARGGGGLYPRRGTWYRDDHEDPGKSGLYLDGGQPTPDTCEMQTRVLAKITEPPF